MATAAGGTHPTRMHSCYKLLKLTITLEGKVEANMFNFCHLCIINVVLINENISVVILNGNKVLIFS